MTEDETTRHRDLMAKRRRLIAVAASGAPGCVQARRAVQETTTALLRLEAAAR